MSQMNVEGRESPSVEDLRKSALETLLDKGPSGSDMGKPVEVPFADWADQMMEMQRSMAEEIVRLKEHINAEVPPIPTVPMEMDNETGVLNEPNELGVGIKNEPMDQRQIPGTSKTPTQDRPNMWRLKHVDSIKFPRLDLKLTQEGGIAYNLWYRTIMDAIEAQDCAFLISGEDPPESYCTNERDVRVAARKVKLFVMSHIDIHYQTIVGHLSDPKEILLYLTKMCEPNSKTFINNLMQQFARMNFESQLESPIEFINRFNELVRKIRQLNPEIMSEPYVKQTFMGAIRETRTCQKELDNDAGYCLKELKDMLVSEFNHIEQMSALDRNIRSGQMLAAGQKPNDRRVGYRGAFRGRARGGRGFRGGNNRFSRGGFPSGSNDSPYTGVLRGGIFRKKVVCYNCGRRGHPYRLCRSLMRKCYNCNQVTTHLAAECPEPKRNPGPSFTPSSRAKLSATKDTKAPKVVKMKLGQAKQVRDHIISKGQSSTFFIAGDTELPDTTDTWVMMGEEDEKQANVLYSRERIGQAAMNVSEGITPKFFRAVVDSGCTEHLANRREYFESLNAFEIPKRFTCANKDIEADLVCKYYGDVVFINNGRVSRLKNVLYSPELSVNLFSLRKATSAGMKVNFSKDDVKFVDSKSGKIIKTGDFYDTYWWIEFELVSNLRDKRKMETDTSCLHLEKKFCSNPNSKNVEGSKINFHTSSSSEVQVGGRSGNTSKCSSKTSSSNEKVEGSWERSGPSSSHTPLSNDSVEKVEGSSVKLDNQIMKFDLEQLGEQFNESLRDSRDILWHVRLNHASKKYLEAATKFIPEMKNVKITNRILDCVDCAEANTVRKPHSEVRNRANKPFVVLHSDLMGPISPANFRNQAKYIVTFMCDSTRYVFAYTMTDKKSVHVALNCCLEEIRNILKEKHSVCSIRTDLGTEYRTAQMKELLQQEHIKLVTSEPHTPQLNGAAERLNLELIQKIRVNLRSAKMPYSFWGHALNYVVYVHNRLPHASNDFKSPYEMLHGNEPSMKYIKRFGCLTMAVNYNPKPKFAPNARRAYLLEFGDTGYLLFDEQNKTLVRSCDVKCIENQVYGDKIKDYPKPLAELLEVITEAQSETNRLDGGLPDESSKKESKNIIGYIEPNSYREAIESPERDLWEDSILDELKSLESNGTWEYVPRAEVDSKIKIIKARWVYKRKLEPNGSFRYKSRLVARGFADTNHYELNEIYAPVARMSDVRIVLAIANKLDLELFQLDVKTAFLYGELEKPVYMEVPEGVVELTDVPNDLRRTHVCRLIRSLYGLKVSPNLWYKKFSSVLENLGFVKYDHQKCVFYWQEDDKFAIMLIYVDDCILASNCSIKANEIISKIALEVEINNLGSPKKFLGLEIRRDRKNKKLFINQRLFVEEILGKYLIDHDKISNLPMLPKSNTILDQLSDHEDPPNVPYREVIGSLLYLQNCSRPDISFAVNFLSRKQVGFTTYDWKCVQKVLSYLKGTANLGLIFTGASDNIESFSDASLGTNDVHGKSTTGFIVRIFGDLVSWKSQKQCHVALSSAEAEYLAMTAACKELTSVRSMCAFLTKINIIPTLFCDCKPAIALAKTDESRTLKHIVKLSYHYVRREFENKNVHIVWVGTNDQLADLLTKALPLEKFITFSEQLLSEP